MQLTRTEQQIVAAVASGAEIVRSAYAHPSKSVWWYRAPQGGVCQVRLITLQKLCHRRYLWPVKDSNGTVVKFIKPRNSAV